MLHRENRRKAMPYDQNEIITMHILTPFFIFYVLLLSCFQSTEEDKTVKSADVNPKSYSLDSSLSQDTSMETKDPDFDELNASLDWKLQFADPCTNDWHTHWFLDGQQAKVENSEKGMNFSAGGVNRDDAHHAVLWTHQSFKGDVKIEYQYRRTDSQLINVNILYIQATGIGTIPYAKDISKWNHLREVPKMSTYFNNMNALHISYAPFETVNDDPDADYIRVRKYPATGEITFRDTEVPPSFDRTGLFHPDESYQITVIKTGSQLFFHVKGRSKERLFSWHLESSHGVSEGRIGLRHMYTRAANYGNFKVSVK